MGIFGRLFRSELTDEEKNAVVQAVNAQFEEEGFSEATIRRFCVAREWEEQAIVQTVKAHVEWRKANLPIERTPVMDRVLESGRVRILRRGKDPIICYDFMWGRMLLDGFKDDDIIATVVWAIEDVLAEADPLCAEGEQAQYVSVVTGGPPPIAYIKKAGAIFEPNYPERLKQCVVYPIPHWMKSVADAIIMLLPKRTQKKFVLLAEEEEFLGITGLSAEDLPDILKGGIEAGWVRREKIALADESTREQLPEVYVEAMKDPDLATQMAMSQVSC